MEKLAAAAYDAAFADFLELQTVGALDGHAARNSRCKEAGALACPCWPDGS